MRFPPRSAPARLAGLRLAGRTLAGLTLAGLLASAQVASAKVVSGSPAGGSSQTGTFSDWPMFMGAPAHTGVSAETAIGTENALQLGAGWTAHVGSTIAYASPVIATSSTLGEAVVYDAAGNYVSAYAVTDGKRLWRYQVPAGAGDIDSTPAVFDGTVYFASTEGTVFAVDASNGALTCSLSVGQMFQASPVVVESPDGSGPVLYDGTDPADTSGAEYAIWGAGNTHGQCTQDWQFTKWLTAGGGTWSSPAYGTDANGTPVVVFGSADPDDTVYAVNATTGKRVWYYRTSAAKNFDVGAPPDISAPGTNGFADGVVYVVGKDRVSYAINLTTGALIWQTALAKGSTADVAGEALVGNTLYAPTEAGVYALNASTGAVIWHVLSPHGFYGSPVVTGPAGQQVLIVNTLGSKEHAGHVYVLNLNGGTLNDIAPLPAGKGFWASPAVSQGTLFIVGLDGVLRTYAPPAT